MPEHTTALTITDDDGRAWEWLLTDRRLRILCRWLGPAAIGPDLDGRRVGRHGEAGAA